MASRLPTANRTDGRLESLTESTQPKCRMGNQKMTNGYSHLEYPSGVKSSVPIFLPVRTCAAAVKPLLAFFLYTDALLLL